MITVNDIFTEINQLIAAQFANVPIYINHCPNGFQRPSFLIRCKDVKREDVNRYTVNVTAAYTISCFAAADEYNQSDIQTLAEMQNTVLHLFRDGYITVEDRAIKVKTRAGITDADEFDEVRVRLGGRAVQIGDATTSDFNRATIELTFEYFDDRTDTSDSYDLMGSVTTDTHLQ